MKSQKVMCHIQTGMVLTYCDYKARKHGKSESDVPCSNRHGTYPLAREHGMSESDVPFKQTWHLHTVITKQESMESQKVMCQPDMALTCCDYKAQEHGKSESDMPCSNIHGTYFL